MTCYDLFIIYFKTEVILVKGTIISIKNAWIWKLSLKVGIFMLLCFSTGVCIFNKLMYSTVSCSLLSVMDFYECIIIIRIKMTNYTFYEFGMKYKLKAVDINQNQLRTKVMRQLFDLSSKNDKFLVLSCLSRYMYTI